MSWASPAAKREWESRNKDKVSAYNARSYQRHKAKRKLENLAWKKANPEKWAIYQQRCKLKYRYCLSEADYEHLLAGQGRHCRFCEATEKLCIDHDHKCCPGEKSCGRCVRFILCTRHNALLGQLENSKNKALLDWFFKEVSI